MNRCDCGGAKAGTTHSSWCATNDTDPGHKLNPDDKDPIDIEFLAEMLKDGGYSPRVMAGQLTSEEMQKLVDALEDLEDDSNSFD